jgi:hypothetical protein
MLSSVYIETIKLSKSEEPAANCICVLVCEWDGESGHGVCMCLCDAIPAAASHFQIFNLQRSSFRLKKRTKELGFRLFYLFFIFVFYCVFYFVLCLLWHNVLAIPDARAGARLEVLPGLGDVLLLEAAEVAPLGLFSRA